MIDYSMLEDAQKGKLLHLFQCDITAFRYNEIHILYDAAHITTSRLLDQLHKHKAAISDIYDAVYVDIAYILIDEIYKNKEIEILFNELYDKRYPEAVKYVNKIEGRYSSGKDSMFRAFQSAILHYIPGASKQYVDNPEFSYFVYKAYNSDKLMKQDLLSEETVSYDAMTWRVRQHGNAEYALNENKYTYTDTSEKIFESKMFAKYVRKTREGIAGYLGVSEDKLSGYIIPLLQHDIRKEDLSYLPGTGIPGYTNASTIHVIQDSYGSAQWLQTITSSRGIRRGSKAYRPDIDRLIVTLCRSHVEIDFLERINKGEDYTKSAILELCKKVAPERAFQAVCYLYNIDIVYQMFREMQERYYADFSWEQVLQKSLLSRNNEVIEDLRSIVRKKEETIISLNRENEALSAGIRKKEGMSAIPFMQETQKLIKTIEQKETEIDRLKEKLSQQEEFINLLNSPGNEEDTQREINLAELQTRKYLFVGFADESLPELRKVFPNSVFMNTDNTAIANVQVDAIVFLLKFMSHGMLYKVRSESKLEGKTCIYCKGRSLRSVYYDMSTALSAL